MLNTINSDSINRLIEANKNDTDELEFIKMCIDTFEKYHKAVFAYLESIINNRT
ncbi:MAG: hypothetical protein J6V14_06260 [Clostridia bacterium]|nr:hypothetical protein [Clostridia bacterium]